MSLIQNLLASLRSALSVDTLSETEERYLSDAIDHADLERRMTSQSRASASTAVINIGR